MNRIAKNTTPTTDRPARSLRGALGNGLIALGERLTETPVDESKDYDRAA